ncbi:MAG: HDOD domain-containing protein [Verrucomicrobiota bacterium]
MKCPDAVLETLASYLPAIPGVVVSLQDKFEDPDCSYQEIDHIVSKDPTLTLRILKLANSPTYGLSKKVESISEALMLIGMAEVKDAIVGTAIAKAFDSSEQAKVFWKHSIACGVCARYLANCVNPSRADGLFMAGLIHDIGRLIMSKAFVDGYKKANQLCESKKIPIAQAEQEVFRFDHTSLAEAILKQWRIPSKLITIVRYHHSPQLAPKSKIETNLLHLADTLADILDLGSSGEPMLDPQNTDEIQLVLGQNFLSNAADELPFLVATTASALDLD